MDNSVSSQFYEKRTSKQRLECLICDYHIDQNDESAFVPFPCNVRAFKDETFKVWRCPNCSTIHCLDVVDIDHYYAKYPFAEAQLTLPFRLCYQTFYKQLIKHGLSQTHSILDYGCGNGLVVNYLRQNGFANTHGYDPYAPKDGFGDATILQKAPFDYILLQDIIEHVEDPHDLLTKLDSLLSPGGYILIGTPDAANIDLTRPELSNYYNAVHVPYHLHIYTRESIESLGIRQGWEVVDFFDRGYDDTRWFGLNTRTWNEYQRHSDGTFNVVFEPFKPWKALTSYRFIFYAIFGYWLSLHTDMTFVFRKSISLTNTAC
jgi:2-polyprenyl-3-methyl-5-hydroxy-6-metoxy-1,4-benzoquinol methylase